MVQTREHGELRVKQAIINFNLDSWILDWDDCKCLVNCSIDIVLRTWAGLGSVVFSRLEFPH